MSVNRVHSIKSHLIWMFNSAVLGGCLALWSGPAFATESVRTAEPVPGWLDVGQFAGPPERGGPAQLPTKGKQAYVQSNVDNTEFYLDGIFLGKGKRLQVILDNRSHTLTAKPEGYKQKEELIQPPFHDGTVIGFYYMIEDKESRGPVGSTQGGYGRKRSLPTGFGTNQKIAIWNVSSRAGEGRFVEVLLGVLASDLYKGGYSVLGQDDAKVALEFRFEKRKFTCDETPCLIEIARALGVDKLVTGSLERSGEGFSINLKLINPRLGKAESQISDACRCPEEDVAAFAGDALIALLMNPGR